MKCFSQGIFLDEVHQHVALARGEVFTDIGVDYLRDARVGTHPLGHISKGLQREQDSNVGVSKLAMKLLFLQKRIAKNNDRSSLEYTIKGNHRLWYIWQDNRNTITRLDAQASQGMSKACTQAVKLTIPYLMIKEEDGGTTRKSGGTGAEHLMEELFRLWDQGRYTAIIMVEPGHFAVLCSERNLAGNALEDAWPFLSTTFDSLSIRLLFLNKAVDGSIDSIGPLELHEMC